MNFTAIKTVLELGDWDQELLCFGSSGDVPAKNFLSQLEDVSTENPVPKDRINHGDDLLYLYTSGSTGLPKAVPFRHSRYAFYTASNT